MGKILADDILKYFSYFSPEDRIWLFMQTVSNRDNLHEMSNPIFWKIKRKITINLSSAESVQWVVKNIYTFLSLDHSMLGKNFSWHFDFFYYYYYYSQNIGFDSSCKLPFQGDNLHEISHPFFRRNKEIYTSNISFAEFTQAMLSVIYITPP